MPTHPVDPTRSTHPAHPPHPHSKTVLLTGAGGVLGTALLPYLRHHRVVALTHRRHPSPSARPCPVTSHGPGWGWTPAYRRLLARTDAVVHAAGMVAFGSGRASMHTVNVEGAGRVARFAAEAGVPLIHVSTAYVARYREIVAAGGNRAERAGNSPADYVASKTAGEEAVAAAGGSVTVVRPSIIIGDSVTGEIAEPQGLHTFAQQVLRNRLPFVPSDPASYVDFVPQDVVARAIVALLDAGARPAEYWLSGGAHALTCDRLVQVIVEEAAEAGLTVRPLRVLAPDVVERLVRPAFFVLRRGARVGADAAGPAAGHVVGALQREAAAQFARRPPGAGGRGGHPGQRGRVAGVRTAADHRPARRPGVGVNAQDDKGPAHREGDGDELS